MKTVGRLIILLFCASLIVPFQNCSAYKSEGRDVYESALAEAENRGCYPYIDTNIAMGFLEVTDDSLFVYKEKVRGEDAHVCDFIVVNNIMNHINCKVSVGSAELALAVKEDGINALPDIGAVWTASAPSLFSGDTFAGYSTNDPDDMRTITFLATEDRDRKGVSCSVRMSVADYSANTNVVRSKLSKITYEMAIQNIE